MEEHTACSIPGISKSGALELGSFSTYVIVKIILPSTNSSLEVCSNFNTTILTIVRCTTNKTSAVK